MVVVVVVVGGGGAAGVAWVVVAGAGRGSADLPRAPSLHLSPSSTEALRRYATAFPPTPSDTHLAERLFSKR